MKPLATVFELGKKLVCFSPSYSLLILSLMLVRSFTAGVGLLLIMPLLNLLGLSTLGHGGDSIAHKVAVTLTFLHIPIHLISILLVFILIITILATMTFFEEMCRSVWQERYQQHLRAVIYRAIIHTRWDYFNQMKRDEFLHSVTSQLQASLVCNLQLFQLIGSLIVIAVYFLLSGLISWKMTCLASVIALGLLGLMLPLHRVTAQSAHAFLKRNQALFHTFYEQLNALKLIKSRHAEPIFIAKIEAEGMSLHDQTRHLSMISAVSKWLYSTGSVMAFSLLLFVAIRVIALPTDALILLLLVFSRLMPKISSLQQNYQLLLRNLPYYSRLQQLIRDCTANQEIHATTYATQVLFEQAIVFQNISFYHNATPIIDRLSLCIPKNTTTALIGPSGAGKTTVADLLVGLLKPTAGTIFIDSVALDEKILLSWRKSVCYVMQDAYLFNATIRENLQLFSANATEASMWDALSQVSAAEFVTTLEHGLDTIVGDRGTQLSGGERQRIILARALLMQPQLLILDESTNALDEQNRQIIQQALLTLRGKMTILIISHQFDMIEFADQVISIIVGPRPNLQQINP